MLSSDNCPSIKPPNSMRRFVRAFRSFSLSFALFSLKLADGHILPLGNEMTLREADKSYVGKELQKEWNQEKAEKEILPAVKRMGLFGKGDTVHEKMMAEQLGKLFAAGRFSQLQMETKDAFHQAAVVSVKLEEKDIAGWNEIIRAMEKAHPEKIDILGENRTLNLETIRESMKKKTVTIVSSIKKMDRLSLFMEACFFLWNSTGWKRLFMSFSSRQQIKGNLEPLPFIPIRPQAGL